MRTTDLLVPSKPINKKDISHLSNDTIHKSLLESRDLPLEPFNLLVAVQRPPVIQSQASHDIRLRAGNSLVQLGELLPSVKLTPQLLDLTVHRAVRQVTVDGTVLRCEGGVVAAGERDSRRIQVQRTGCVADFFCGEGGCGSGVFHFGETLLDIRKGPLFTFAEPFEFLGDAFLDLEFEGPGARRIGLYVYDVYWLMVFCSGLVGSGSFVWAYLGAGLESLHEVGGELDRGVAVR